MNDKCVHCGSEEYGPGCAYGSDGVHYHPMNLHRCRYCGSENRGGKCSLNPYSTQHIHGIGNGICVLCDFPEAYQDDCPGGENGHHDIIGPDVTTRTLPVASSVRFLTVAGRFEEALARIKDLSEDNRHDAILAIASGLVMHASTPSDHSHPSSQIIRALDLLKDLPPDLYTESCKHVAESVAKTGNVEKALSFCMQIPDSNTLMFVADLLDDYVLVEVRRSLRDHKDFDRAKTLAYSANDHVALLSRVADEMARSGEITKCLELVRELTGRNEFADLECGSACWQIGLYFQEHGNHGDAEKYFRMAEQGLDIRTKYSCSQHDRSCLRHALRAIKDQRMDHAWENIQDIEDPEVLKKLIRVSNALEKTTNPENSIFVSLVHKKLADIKSLEIRGLASKLATSGKLAEANRLFYTALDYISSCHRRPSGPNSRKEPEGLLELSRALDACGFTKKAEIFRIRADEAGLNNRAS